MKRKILAPLFFYLLITATAFGQTSSIDKVKFFKDTSTLNATLTTDFVHLFRQRTKEGKQFPGYFSTSLSGDTSVNVPVVLELRGHMRKEHCNIPPVRINFKSDKKSPMAPLGTLKLVNQCVSSSTDEQYLLKEFLVYKIYNMISDLSYRVRLLKLTLADSNGKKRPTDEYAFLVEDIKDLAKRNDCKQLKTIKLNELQTDRKQMTTVAIFEYMIGNTDWGVAANHNTRLILSTTDSGARPYVIPYDFDYSGLVNTNYAVPDESLGIQNVRERLYRGFPRSIQEINEALEVFKNKKEAIYALINGYPRLTEPSKKDMIQYLDDFYKVITDPRSVKNTFIDNARTE